MNRSGLIKFTPSETPDIGFPDLGSATSKKKSSGEEDISSGKVTGLYGNAVAASDQLYAIEANINSVTNKLEKVLRSASDPDSGLSSQEGQALSQTLTNLYMQKAQILNLQPFAAEEASEWYKHQEKINQNNAGGQYTTNYPGMESIVFGGGTVQDEMTSINKEPSISIVNGLYNFDKRTMPSYYKGNTLASELSAQKTLALQFKNTYSRRLDEIIKGGSVLDLSGKGDIRFFYQGGSFSTNENYLQTLMKDIPILISEDAKREAYDKLNKELKNEIYEFMNLMEEKPDRSDPKKLAEWNKRNYASGRFGQDVASDEEMSNGQRIEKIAYTNIYEATDIAKLSNDLIDPKLTEEQRKASKDKLTNTYGIEFTGNLKNDSDNIKNAYSIRKNTADRHLKEVADISYMSFLVGEVENMENTEQKLTTTSVELPYASKLGFEKKSGVVPVTQIETAATIGVGKLPGVSYNIHNIYGQSVYLPTASSNETLDMFGKKLDNMYFTPKLSTGQNSLNIFSGGGHPLGVSQELIDNGYVKVNIPQDYKIADVPIQALTESQLKVENSFAFPAWQLADQLAASGKYTPSQVKSLYMEKYKNDPKKELNWEIAQNIIFKRVKNKEGKYVNKRISKTEMEALVPITKPFIYATMYISDDFESMSDEARSTSETQGITLKDAPVLYNKVKYKDYNVKGEKIESRATYIKESNNEVKKEDKHPMEGYWEMPVLIPLENINLGAIISDELSKEKAVITSKENIETINEQGSK